jgi:hypothetical protein
LAKRRHDVIGLDLLDRRRAGDGLVSANDKGRFRFEDNDDQAEPPLPVNFFQPASSVL